MHFQLYKEDVLELLRRQGEFADYTMAQLLQDLDALVGWKNLTPLQDPRKVYTGRIIWRRSSGNCLS